MTDTTPALRPDVLELIASVERIADPVERFEATRVLTEELKGAMQALKGLGRGAAEELRAGRTLREVGELLGISTARVDQVLKGR